MIILFISQLIHFKPLLQTFFHLSERTYLIFISLPLQILMLTVVPVGFMAFVPVAALLGKPIPVLGEFAPLAAIAAGPIAVLIAAWFWRFCLDRYQGAGG